MRDAKYVTVIPRMLRRDGIPVAASPISMLPEFEALSQQIRMAFASIPRPARMTKRVARALDDEWVISEDRWNELYSQDTEMSWVELTNRDIEEFCFTLPWLDNEGFAFYLPAFMSYCLRRFPDQDHRAVCDTHSACADASRWHLFNAEQLACIRAFLDV